MNRFIFAFGIAALLVIGNTNSANAYCGVIQESASAKNVKQARKRANQKVNRQIYDLRKKNGKKLVVEAKSIACLGGAVAIDSNGKQIVGNPSCTVTAPFCVNP